MTRRRPAPGPPPPHAGPLRVLLTGFPPFGGEAVNPSELLVRELAAQEPPAALELRAAVLPVDRALIASALAAALVEHRPDAVVAVGQATGRAVVDLEGTAVNLIDFKDQRDNGGHEAHGEAWVPGAPPRRRVRLPLPALARALAGRGLPVAVSRDAGRHLCNATLYLLLHRHAGLPALFVHVPLLPDQAARRGKDEPSLPLEVSRQCLSQLLGLLPDLLAAPPPARTRAAAPSSQAARPAAGLRHPAQ